MCVIVEMVNSMKKKQMVENSNKAVFHTGEVLTLIILTCLISLLVGGLVAIQFEKKQNMKSNDKYIQSFVDNYEYILENYYGDIDKDTLIKGALNGMLSVLGDDYSTLLEGSSADNFNIQLDGNYEGIGVEIYKYDNQIIILNVFSGSPAEQVGLKEGDIISSVDGTVYTETSELSDYIRNNTKKHLK